MTTTICILCGLSSLVLYKGNKMIKVMFICHGNICRSPMAEFILRKMICEAHLEGEVETSSSATSREEIWGNVGNPVYPPAVRELKKHGIDPLGKRAVQLNADDYEKYDIFIAMDDNNVRNSLRIFTSDPKGKLCKLMDFTSRGGNVADPWYTDRFDIAYNDIYEGCLGVMDWIRAEIKGRRD